MRKLEPGFEATPVVVAKADREGLGGLQPKYESPEELAAQIRDQALEKADALASQVNQVEVLELEARWFLALSRQIQIANEDFKEADQRFQEALQEWRDHGGDIFARKNLQEAATQRLRARIAFARARRELRDEGGVSYEEYRRRLLAR